MIENSKNNYLHSIDLIYKEFCKEKVIYEDTMNGHINDEILNFVDKYCLKLVYIFKNVDEYPNYFIIALNHNKLSTEARMGIGQNCENFKKCLLNNNVKIIPDKYKGIKTYYENEHLRNMIDMFIKFVSYQTSLCINKNEALQKNDTKISCTNISENSKNIENAINSPIEKAENLGEQSIPTVEKEENSFLNSVQENIDVMEGLTRQISTTISRAQDEFAHVTTTNITTIGIFVAVIVAFISAFLSGNIALSSGTIEVIQFRFMFALFLGQLLFNLIFFLLFMVARVAHRKISLECNHNVEICKNCVCSDPNCGALKRTWRKYPYMIVINIILFAIYLLFIDWWIIDKYVYSNANATIYSKIIIPSICVIASLILLECILTIFIKMPMYSDIKKNKPYFVNLVDFIKSNKIDRHIKRNDKIKTKIENKKKIASLKNEEDEMKAQLKELNSITHNNHDSNHSI